MNRSIYSQRGAAIITALLVVMLAATIATYLISQQSAALTRIERANERTQLSLYARPTLEWARSALFLLQRDNPPAVHLNQPWAQQLVARPIESAIASGLLRDEQGKFNLNNLVDSAGKAREPDLLVFKRLLKSLGIDESIAANIADWIDADDDTSAPGSAENGYYTTLPQPYRAANRELTTIDELYRVRGIDGAIMRKLVPFISALPKRANERTKINVNTTSREILAAVYGDVPKEAVNDLLLKRDVPITDIGSISAIKALPQATTSTFLDTKSRFFEATFSITGQRAQVRQAALIELNQPASASPNSPGVKPNQQSLPAIIWLKDL
jgi:general secretion pathway protein K